MQRPSGSQRRSWRLPGASAGTWVAAVQLRPPLVVDRNVPLVSPPLRWTRHSRTVAHETWSIQPADSAAAGRGSSCQLAPLSVVMASVSRSVTATHILAVGQDGSTVALKTSWSGGLAIGCHVAPPSEVRSLGLATPERASWVNHA